jgi:hypothetical protein
MLLVPSKVLLLVAAAVWLAAGVSVCSVGVGAIHGWTVTVGVSFLVIYILFLVMFIRISSRHIRRIRSYADELTSLFKFFDTKTYIVMAVMIGLGFTVRLSGLVPDPAIAAFYSGLGLALITSAVYYTVSFVACADGLLRGQHDYVSTKTRRRN